MIFFFKFIKQIYDLILIGIEFQIFATINLIDFYFKFNL